MQERLEDDSQVVYEKGRLSDTIGAIARCGFRGASIFARVQRYSSGEQLPLNLPNCQKGSVFCQFEEALED